MKKKSMILVLALVLLAMGVAGGTLAWLTSHSDKVTNTFTGSNITVSLEETTGTEYKMIPGYEIAKDPAAWVEEGSEDCYLFVKLEKSADFDTYLSYEVETGGKNWTRLTGSGVTDEIYYRIVTSAEMGETHKFHVLKDDQVVVSDQVTGEMMAALDGQDAAKPVLSITAYASQLHKNANENFEPLAAWRNLAD